MGVLKSLNRFYKGEKQKQKAFQLSKALQIFYASHLMSDWQRAEITKIRTAHEAAQKKLEMAHNMAASRVSEQYMQLELDTAYALHEWREANPGMEYVPREFGSLFKKAFWKNLLVKAEKLGVTFNHGEAK